MFTLVVHTGGSHWWFTLVSSTENMDVSVKIKFDMAPNGWHESSTVYSQCQCTWTQTTVQAILDVNRHDVKKFGSQPGSHAQCEREKYLSHQMTHCFLLSRM